MKQSLNSVVASSKAERRKQKKKQQKLNSERVDVMRVLSYTLHIYIRQ